MSDPFRQPLPVERRCNAAILLLAAILLVWLAGCSASQGLDRSKLERGFAADGAQATDAEIARVLALKPQLPQPFRLGIYLMPGYRGGAELDRQHLLDERWLTELQATGIVSDVVWISPLTVVKQSLEEIRLGAARNGADAVLIVNASYDVDRYNNFSSVLYLTIVGLFLVPGTHADALVLVKGALWDVRNGFLYFTASAEGRAEKLGSAVLLDNVDAIRPATEAAVDAFAEVVLARFKGLAARMN